MTNDNKPPMFGPSAMFDPSTHEPRSGKSALMNELMAEFAGKPDALAETVFAPTRSGMSADYSALGLTDAEVAKIKIIDKD